VDPDSPFSIAPLTHFVVLTTNALPALLEAFRTGGGLTWADYGRDSYEAQGNFNRPWLLSQFVTEHLAKVPDVEARLMADPPARVADFGCGAGWASIAIAKAFPKVVVDGFDLEEAAIDLARKNAAEAGVADRVSFKVADITDPAMTGRYDLVVAIELIHDLARPVEALATIRRVLAPGGAAILLEEKVADRFTPGDPLDRFMYGWSVLFCLPVGMNEQPSAGTGTVMRPDTLRRYARDAGFSDIEILDIDLPLQRYYRLIA
jgi:2-polyprenyl-3-methyl-5-hydroxy-6-metoxy-1,4-benzoquinol methylase